MWIQKYKFICKMMRAVKNTKKSGGFQVCTHRANNTIDIFKAIVLLPLPTTCQLSLCIWVKYKIIHREAIDHYCKKKANVLAEI